MKFSTILTTAIVLIVGLSVLGCENGSSPLESKGTVNRKAEIKLRISNAGLKVVGAEGHVGTCKIHKIEPDCVNVPKGNTAEIKFKLIGWKDWNFSRIQLVHDDPSDKLDFANQTGFTSAMIDDFYVVVDGADVHPDSNGIIDLTGMEDGRNFTFHDKNQLKQHYRYQIEACKEVVDKAEEVKCEPSDPRLENEG